MLLQREEVVSKANSFLIAVAILAVSAMVEAQDLIVRDITVLVSNGKTGRPMPNERVIVYEFDGAPPQHDVSVELHTDANGVAILHGADIHRKKLQLWVDKRTQCVADPNHLSFAVAEIRRNGDKGPNTCAGFLDSTRTGPNVIEIFARPATLRERMAW